MGIMVYSLVWAIQDLYHQPLSILWPSSKPSIGEVYILFGCMGLAEPQNIQPLNRWNPTVDDINPALLSQNKEYTIIPIV